MPAATSIVWFRRDLRLSDHAPLVAAAARGAVVPVFIWAPDEEGAWPPKAPAAGGCTARSRRWRPRWRGAAPG